MSAAQKPGKAPDHGSSSSSSSDSSGPPVGPSYGSWRVADSLAAAQGQKRKVTLILSVYLIIILVVQSDLGIQAKNLGVEIKDPGIFLALSTLALSLVIAHLSGLMTRSARLARAMGYETSIELNATEKLQMELVTSGDCDERALMKRAGWDLRLYWLTRLGDRFLTYLFVLAILFSAFWVALRQLATLFRASTDSLTMVVSIVGSCVLLALAVLRLAQYWALRAQTSFAASIASMLAFVVFLPFRAKALQAFEADRYPPKEGTAAWMLWDMARMTGQDDPALKELRDRRKNYRGWKKLLWSLYGSGLSG